MELFKQNYNAVRQRGLITDNTTDREFCFKLNEEVSEIHKAFYESDERLIEEIADALNVCSNWLIHKNVDLKEILQKILDKNLARVK
jgi:phosphoribosyl-ATP pyrophosphohydrolase